MTIYDYTQGGKTPLHLAAMMNDIESMELLLLQRAKANVRDNVSNYNTY